MKVQNAFIVFAITVSVSAVAAAQTNGTASTGKESKATTHLYIDVHHLEPGKVEFKDVAAAHAKDFAVEKKYGVNFIKYWVDKDKGLVYCLSSSPDTASITKTHAEAHGLLPTEIYEVTDGKEATLDNQKNYYLDVHELGAGNVTAAAVADAHKKDLAVEGKYNVNFINYWVNEKEGVVMCLSQAPDSSAVIKTHKEAHGLLPAYISTVKQGK